MTLEGGESIDITKQAYTISLWEIGLIGDFTVVCKIQSMVCIIDRSLAVVSRLVFRSRKNYGSKLRTFGFEGLRVVNLFVMAIMRPFSFIDMDIVVWPLSYEPNTKTNHYFLNSFIKSSTGVFHCQKSTPRSIKGRSSKFCHNRVITYV